MKLNFKIIKDQFDVVSKISAMLILLHTVTFTTIENFKSIFSNKVSLLILLSLIVIIILRVCYKIWSEGNKAGEFVLYKYTARQRKSALVIMLISFLLYLLSCIYLLFPGLFKPDNKHISNIIIINNFEKDEQHPFTERVKSVIMTEIEEKSLDSLAVTGAKLNISNLNPKESEIRQILKDNKCFKGIFAFGQYYVESGGNNSLNANVILLNLPLPDFAFSNKLVATKIRIYALDTLNFRIETKAILLAKFILSVYYQRSGRYEESQMLLNDILKEDINLYPDFKYYCNYFAGINSVGLEKFELALQYFENAYTLFPNSREINETISAINEILFTNQVLQKNGPEILKGENGKYKFSKGVASIYGYFYDTIIFYRGFYLAKRLNDFHLYNVENDEISDMGIGDLTVAKRIVISKLDSLTR